MAIDAAFVQGWSKVYELRGRQVSAAGGTSYRWHLPTGIRHVAATPWDVEVALLAQLHNRASLSRDQFLEVCYWKTPRRFEDAASNAPRAVTTATAKAFGLLTDNPSDPEGAATALMHLRGVGVPTASALLTMAYPDLATVLDIRALRTLHANGELRCPNARWQRLLATEPQAPFPATRSSVAAYRTAARSWWGKTERIWRRQYAAYVEICLGVLSHCGGAPLTLRNLDRALWYAGGATQAPK